MRLVSLLGAYSIAMGHPFTHFVLLGMAIFIRREQRTVTEEFYEADAEKSCSGAMDSSLGWLAYFHGVNAVIVSCFEASKLFKECPCLKKWQYHIDFGVADQMIPFLAFQLYYIGVLTYAGSAFLSCGPLVTDQSAAQPSTVAALYFIELEWIVFASAFVALIAFLWFRTVVKWFNKHGDLFSFQGMNQTYLEDSLLKNHYDAEAFVMYFQDAFVYLVLALYPLTFQRKDTKNEQTLLWCLVALQVLQLLSYAALKLQEFGRPMFCGLVTKQRTMAGLGIFTFMLSKILLPILAMAYAVSLFYVEGSDRIILFFVLASLLKNLVDFTLNLSRKTFFPYLRVIRQPEPDNSSGPNKEWVDLYDQRMQLKTSGCEKVVDECHRKLVFRESIYSLCFISYLNDDHFAASEQQKPHENQRFELLVASWFCAFAQIFISWNLIVDFSSSAVAAFYVPWQEHLARFICGSMFHFTFMNEIGLYLRMMKWLLMHHESVKYTFQPFLMALLAFIAITITEVLNIWNLVNINGGMKDIIFDYIALCIIADFDEIFINIYSSSFMAGLTGDMNISFTKFRKPKSNLLFTKKTKQINDTWTSLDQQEGGDQVTLRGSSVEHKAKESKLDSEELEKGIEEWNAICEEGGVTTFDEEEKIWFRTSPDNKQDCVDQLKELHAKFLNFNDGAERPKTKTVDAFGKETEVNDVRHSKNWWKHNHMTIVYTGIYYPLRLFFISVYYYVFPFAIILTAWFVGFYTAVNEKAEESAIAELAETHIKVVAYLAKQAAAAAATVTASTTEAAAAAEAAANLLL